MYARLCTPEDDMIQVGRIHYGIRVIRYMSSSGFKELGSNTEVEVLVCRHSTSLPGSTVNEPSIETTKEITTTSTTVSTTTTREPCANPPPRTDDTPYTPLGPCGTLVPYDPSDPIKRHYPEMFGVRAGWSWKTQGYQYIGYQNATECDGQDRSPGYVQTDGEAGW